MNAIKISEVISQLPDLPEGYNVLDDLLIKKIMKQNIKIFVLDDDPTGVQTVNNIPVLTVWDEESIRSAFLEKANLIYILTNSRGLKARDAEHINSVIAERICNISIETGKAFKIISRSDSTLRGHYPLETETIRRVIEEKTDIRIDGEIIIPYFKEGGRYTVNDIHWVEDNGRLIPAGETEFAKDAAFGYENSDLKLWVEEKTLGKYK